MLLLFAPPTPACCAACSASSPTPRWLRRRSAEIGNIVGTSYVNALADMTGLAIEPTPPQSTTDMLGAIVATVLAGVAGADDVALVLDSDLKVEGDDCTPDLPAAPDPRQRPGAPRAPGPGVVTVGEEMVRMGELAVSRAPGRHARLARPGLLHRPRPAGRALGRRRARPRGAARLGRSHRPGRAKFADIAVPTLVAELERLGAARLRLKAVLVGGASMFALSSGGLDVGPRNESAVRDALKGLRIPIAATETGGDRGRTIRVSVAGCRVTSREAGGVEDELFSAGAPLRWAA